MSNLVNFKENLKDSMTNSLLDYVNYMHETKNNKETNDSLAKCVVMCGELFANKVKKGEISQSEIESFESNLIDENAFAQDYKELNLANTMVKETNAMSFAEYESTFGDNTKGLKKVA